MKSIFIILLSISLVGCATNQQTGTLMGAAVGAATGKVLAGDAGAVFGTVLGASAGQQLGHSLDKLNNNETEIVQIDSRQIYYMPPPNIVYIRPYYPALSVNWIWVYTPSHGWGWYHRHHGFYLHKRNNR